MPEPMTNRQRQILDYIVEHQGKRGFPPSVREICAAVGLKSPATVKVHLDNLIDRGHLLRDPNKPRAIQVRYHDPEGGDVERRPARHVPLIGDVAAGTGVLAEQNFEEMIPVATDLIGDGECYVLRVRGDSMIDAGILEGDFVVVRSQSTADKGDVVVAGLPGDEATIKTYDERYGQVILIPSNPEMRAMWYDPEILTIYGRVVALMRSL